MEFQTRILGEEITVFKINAPNHLISHLAYFYSYI